MKKTKIIFAIILGMILSVQLLSFTSTNSIRLPKIQYIEVDKLDNCYAVANETIYKYNAKLERIGRYSSQNGTISDVEVENPFKIILFFKDHYTISILDNTLSELQTIFLPDYNILQPQAIAMGSENGIWVADRYMQKIHFIDFSNQNRRESFSFGQHCEGENGEVIKVVEQDRGILIYFTNHKRVQLDRFGGFMNQRTDTVPQKAYYKEGNRTFFSYQNDTLSSITK